MVQRLTDLAVLKPLKKEKDLEDEEEVETLFEFFDPCEGDFLGMKGLLGNYLDGEPYDCSALVDHVIAQSTVGRVLRLEDQLDPIAVVSVVNLAKHRDAKFLTQVAAFLDSRAPHDEARRLLRERCFGRKRGCGLIVSERVVNCPLELSSPLCQSIFDEIEWATEDEPTQERRQEFELTDFLLLSRVYFTKQDHAEEAGGSGSKGKAKAKGKKRRTGDGGKGGGGALGEIVYVRPEDEHLHRESDWSFTFQAGNKAESSPGLVQHRLVMGIKKEGVRRARAELDKVFGGFLPT